MIEESCQKFLFWHFGQHAKIENSPRTPPRSRRYCLHASFAACARAAAAAAASATAAAAAVGSCCICLCIERINETI